MQRYRSKETYEAVQYKGQPIPGVTCEGNDAQYAQNGCDGNRRWVPHIHTKAIGGIRCLTVGDWIMPDPGGPWLAVPDAKFRANVEVPEDKPVAIPVAPADKTVVLWSAAPEVPAATLFLVNTPEPFSASITPTLDPSSFVVTATPASVADESAPPKEPAGE